MSHYISTADITDSVAKAFVDASDSRLEQWLTNVDNEIIRMALQNDLLEEDILDPLNSIVKEYLVAYFCLLVFRDNIGSNNVEVSSEEKYRIKYDLYVSETERLRPLCTKDIISTEEASVEPVNMTGVKYFVRG
jgi:hypothetical protein